MKTINVPLPETFTRTFTVSKEEGSSSTAEVNLTVKIAEDLTVESLLNILARPIIIRAQAKLRSNWNKKENPTSPAPTMTVVLDNTSGRQESDPLKKFREAYARAKGIKVEEVTDKMALKIKAAMEALDL